MNVSAGRWRVDVGARAPTVFLARRFDGASRAGLTSPSVTSPRARVHIGIGTVLLVCPSFAFHGGGSGPGTDFGLMAPRANQSAQGSRKGLPHGSPGIYGRLGKAWNVERR